MITYINDENKQDYTVLFEKASTKLGLLPIIEEVRDPETLEITKQYSKRVQTPSGWTTVPCAEGEVDESTDLLLDSEGNPILPITSLNEYFQHIKDLAALAIGKGRSGSDPYFLRLPLDEPYFEINANTRGITVPGELSQIAVRGDKLAEIVFFRIDRYYDAVDLNTRHIYIEWELPDGTKGISRDFLRDTQSEKDKLIFGWAIGEELTKQVGTIRFAVRFVEWFDVANTEGDGDADQRIESADKAVTGSQMLYSFSSLPATVSVVESLNYSLFEDDEALKVYNTAVTDENIGTIVLYLENSDADSADSTAPESAEYPVFVRDLTGEYYTNATRIGETNEYKINLVDGKLELRVEANADDAGHISYVFGRIAHTEDEGTGVAATGANGLTADIKFIPTTDSFDANGESGLNKTYYIFDNAYQTYLVATADDIKNAPAGSIYERVAVIEVAAPGHYYAIADNAVSGKKIASTHSSRFYIPWASKPIATEPMLEEDGTPAKLVLNKVEYQKVIEDVQQVGEAPPSNITFVVGDAINTNGVELKPIFSADDAGSLTYTWYKHTDNHAVTKSDFDIHALDRPDGLTNEAWAEQEAALIADAGWTAIEGANAATYTATEPGCYAVKVDNYFNNDHTEANLFEGGISRVTNMPAEPTITNWDEVRNYPSTAGSVTIPDIKIQVTDNDVVRYTWHMITSDNTDEDEIAEGFMAESTGTVAVTPVAGLENTFEGAIQFRPLKPGLFYLVLENELNGSTAYVNTAKGYGKIRVSVEA